MMIMTQSHQQLLATELIGKDAVHQEQRVGEVNDLLLDKNGRIAGVVLAVDGVLTTEEKRVALPWDHITVCKTGKHSTIRTAMTKEELEAAPHFESVKSGLKASGLTLETHPR